MLRCLRNHQISSFEFSWRFLHQKWIWAFLHEVCGSYCSSSIWGLLLGILVAANEAVRIHNSWGMTKDPVTVLWHSVVVFQPGVLLSTYSHRKSNMYFFYTPMIRWFKDISVVAYKQLLYINLNIEYSESYFTLCCSPCSGCCLYFSK